MSWQTTIKSAARKPMIWIHLTQPLTRALVFCLFLFLLVVAIIAISSPPTLPRWFWYLTLLSLLLLLVVWWFTLGIQWFERRRFLRTQSSDLSAEHSQAEAQSAKHMETAVNDAVTILQRSPQTVAQGSPLYRVPWFLFLGGSITEQASLLREASKASPFPPASPITGGDYAWSWWFYKNMVAIETSSSFVCDAGERLPRGNWYQALQLLYKYRPKLPLNGIVLLVSTKHLLGLPEELHVYSLRLRRLVDEAMEQLQINIPIYLVVTGLENLAGFSTTLKLLPTGVREQVLGERIESDQLPTPNPWKKIGDIFVALRTRLHAIRLSLLKREFDPKKRREIFEFVESFSRLKPGLDLATQVLIEDNPFQYAPKLRGIYFIGSDPEPAYINDLFVRFLPSDQPLAKHRKQWNLRSRIRTLIGIGCVAGLSVAITGGIYDASVKDRSLLAITQTACNNGNDLEPSRMNIGVILACHSRLVALEDESLERPFTFWQQSHVTELRNRKQSFVSAFERTVLQPYDTKITGDINVGKIGFQHYLAIVERLAVLRRCASGHEDCNVDRTDSQFIFDQLAPFVSVSADSRAMYKAYLSYVLWQNPLKRQEEAERLTGYLQQLIQLRPLHPDDVVAWAKPRYETYTIERLWRPPKHFIPSPSKFPQVDAAYTLMMVKNVLIPFRQQLLNSGENQTQFMEHFYREYWSNYFRQWGNFLSNFPSGSSLWKGEHDDLLALLAEGESPYKKLWSAIEQNIFNLPLDLTLRMRLLIYYHDIKSNWTDLFPVTRRYFQGWLHSIGNSNMVIPPTWVIATQDYLASQGKESSEIFGKLIRIVNQDKKGQQTYSTAVDIFSAKSSERSENDGPAQDFKKLMQITEKPGETFISEMKPDDFVAWAGINGVPRLLLEVIAYRAGQYIQRQWQVNIINPLQTMSRGEQELIMFGAGGKINAFFNDWLKPFVTEKEKRPIKILDASLSFSAGYQMLLDKQLRIAPLINSTEPFLAGTFRFTHPSSVGRLSEGTMGTELSLNCRGNRFSLSSKAELLSERTAKIYWAPAACDNIRLKIYLPELASQEGLFLNGTTPTLVKTYIGQKGFMQFISDFDSGSKTFSLGDFKISYSPSEWTAILTRIKPYDINVVKVFLEIQESPELERFIIASRDSTSIPTILME